MNVTMGNQIRRLRRDRGMTQEQLAELVGISFQAVSKWENNIALPDITLVPRLAQIFGVSTDVLFGCDLREMEEEVERICDDAYKCRFNDPEESRRILEEGLARYPENDILLNNLLCVIDYEKNPDEMILTASRLADRTRLDDVRYDALRYLSYAYKAKGDLKSAEAALEQIPEIYFTKLEEVAFVLEGEKKYEAARNQKWISFESTLMMMRALSECYEADGRPGDAIAELRRALRLTEAMLHGDKVFEKKFKGLESELREQLEKLENA